MKQPSFDEMQMSLRYQIAGQGFTIMTTLLLLDYIAASFGVHWIPYPDNIFAIVVLSCSFVTIRRITRGCYVAPGKTVRNTVSRPILLVLLCVGIAAAGAFALIGGRSGPGPEPLAIREVSPWLMPLCYLLLAAQGFAYLWFVWREQRHRNDE